MQAAHGCQLKLMKYAMFHNMVKFDKKRRRCLVEAVKNGGTRNVLAIVAFILVSLMVLVSLVVSAILYSASISNKKEINALKEEVASLKGSFSSLQGSYTALAEGDIAKLKEDVLVLMSERSLPKPNFKIESFKIEQSKGGFYMGRYPYTSFRLVYYSTGTGIVSCDSKSPYLVLLKATKSGQEPNKPEDQTLCVYVVNGEGKFNTSDWTIEHERANPEYKFEIITYIPVSTAN